MLLISSSLSMGLATTAATCSRSAGLLTRLCSSTFKTSRQTLCMCNAPLRMQKDVFNSFRCLHLLQRGACSSPYFPVRTHPTLKEVSRHCHRGMQRNLHVSSVEAVEPLCRCRQPRGGHAYARCLHRSASVQFLPLHRFTSTGKSRRQPAWQQRNMSVMLYVIAGAVLVVGFSYAAVPLYTVFCQATGLGGQATVGHDTEKVETMSAVKDRELTIRFNADTAASMRWNFRPQQTEVKLVPGETALAFYSAMNPTDKPIVGISTYNVVPFDAGQYFNKIQCFCFEEQRLNPHEQVDMPVFFYIDPDFVDDPKMEKVTNITLSYTFFESKEGLELPDPMSR